jgi:flagellar hook-basal body complex protein FliE
MTGVVNALSAAQVSAGMKMPVTAEPTSSAVPFGGMLESMVKEGGALDAKAQAAVTGLMNGSGVEVHDAMIATEKADMAFELGLQMRNKAVAAYQQMMTMQF